MRIGIIGIGGIGGFVGSKLVKAYSRKGEHEVVFIQRGKHGEAIQKNGLQFIGKELEIIIPDACYSNFENAGIFDLIFVCTKSKDLEKTAQQFEKNIHKKTVVIPLLNGVQNAQRIQSVLQQTRVLQGCIYVSSAIETYGTVKQIGGAGNIFFGPTNCEIAKIDIEIESVLKNAGLRIILSDSIQYEVWKKYLFISTFATITSRYNKHIGEVVRDEALLSLTKSLINEIMLLAKKLNVNLTKEDADNVIDLALKIPIHTPTSMQLDVYSGRLPELDIFAGFIVFEGKMQNLRLPFHETIYKNLVTIIQEQMHG